MANSIGQIKILALTSEEHLEHHGIKGQKWGVRRFQNYDGSLKKRTRPESSTWKSKDAAELSDAELNRRNSRLAREKQYRDATKSKGRKFLEGLGKAAAGIFLYSLTEVAKEKMKTDYRTMLDVGAKFIKQKAASAAASVIMATTKLRK